MTRQDAKSALEGLTFDESKADHPKDYYALVNRNINHVISKGESYRHLLKRATGKLIEVMRAWEDLCADLEAQQTAEAAE